MGLEKSVGIYSKNSSSYLQVLLKQTLPIEARLTNLQLEKCCCVFFDLGNADHVEDKELKIDSKAFKVLYFDPSHLNQLNALAWDAVFLKNEPSPKILEIVEKSFEQFENNKISRIESLDTRDQMVSLNLAKEQLEKSLYEHVSNLEKSKKEMQKSLSDARAYTVYLNKLAHCEELEEILKLLRDELKQFPSISNISLILSLNKLSDTIVSFQKGGYLFKRTKNQFAQGNTIRFNEEADRSGLASLLERPIGKVMVIPIKRRERGRRSENRLVNDYLVVEHSVSDKDVAGLLSLIQKRLEPFASSVDRALLIQQVHMASQIWERVFDHLNDGLAIVSTDGDLLRSNSAFKMKLAGWSEFSNVLNSELQELTWRDRRYEIRKFPIALPDGGAPVAQIIFFRDLTDDEEMRTALLQNEKMAAIGSLAGRIAHELNNPLTGIVSMCQVLIAENKLKEQVLQDLGEIEAASKRCQDIIKNLLDFTEQDRAFELENVEINDVVNKTIPLLKTALRDVNLDIQLSIEPLTFRGNFRLLQQVLFNLLINACQASPKSGEIVLSTSLHKNVDGDQVQLSVRDQGAGIPPHLQNKIFDHFFTTKERGKGTGLGLSVSKSIVESFGGRIVVKSEYGHGSEFLVQLPLGTSQ